MPLIIPANSASASGGFEVANSVRYNNGSSDYLSRTQSASPTSATKGTFSVWLKRCLLGVDQYIYTVFQDGNNRMQMNMMDSDHLKIIQKVSASTTISLITNRVFRDVSAFYHICIAIDTTQGTASNRIKMYINGVQETSFSTETYPAQNQDAFFTKGTAVSFGAYNSESNYTSGYFAEAVMIDGQQLAPEDNFIEFDEDSGICKPIDVSGLTFGTNGFYLDFEDSSALGDDVSGNGNDFTVNNLTAIDQSTDTCTNNFATMNPLDNYYASTTFSEGNLKLVTPNPSGWNATNTATMGVSSGKWYWELLISTDNNVALYGIKSGVATGEANYLTETTANGDLGYGIVTTSGNMGYPNGQSESYGAAIDAGDIMMFALDMDNLKFYFGKGGTWGNSGNPAGNSNGYTITAPPSGFYFPAGANFVAETVSYNFGSPPYAISSGNTDGNGYGNFEYSVPSGYLALNTKNLSEVLS